MDGVYFPLVENSAVTFVLFSPGDFLKLVIILNLAFLQLLWLDESHAEVDFKISILTN